MATNINFYKNEECTQAVSTGDRPFPDPAISILAPSSKIDEVTIYAKITDLAATFYPHITLIYEKRNIEYLGASVGGTEMKIFEVSGEGKDALEFNSLSGGMPTEGECYAFSGTTNALRVDKVNGNKISFTDEDLSYIKKGELAFKLLPLFADGPSASKAVHAVKLIRRVSFADVTKRVDFRYYLSAYWSDRA